MGMILNWVYETKQELNNPDQVRVDCIVVEADFLSSGLHNICSLLSKELGNVYFRQPLQFVMFVLRGVYLQKYTCYFVLSKRVIILLIVYFSIAVLTSVTISFQTYSSMAL